MWNPLLEILLGLPILDKELLFSNNYKSPNHLIAPLPAQQALYHFHTNSRGQKVIHYFDNLYHF